MKRFTNRIYYFVESLFLRGSAYQLLFVAVGIFFLSLAGGAAVYALSPEYADFSRALWWAFLRLTDPGYLGEDQGTVPRTISTILTLAGYVFFLGALVAIMTNRLNQFMTNLASGLSPIFEKEHILILGWNPRIHSLVEEIGHAEERVKRRLGRASLPAVVILTREFDPNLRKELLEKLEPPIKERVRVLIRSGDPLEAESLERVDFKRSSSIILVSPTEGPESRHLSDIQLVKILLSLKAQSRDVDPEELPNVVLEIGDPANKVLAENAGWRRKTEAIASDEFMSRLIGHTIRNPGLSGVYNHLLTDTFGQSIYLRQVGRLGVEEMKLRDAVRVFQQAIPIGVLRPSRAPRRQEKRLQLLDLDAKLQAEDELIFVAPSIDALYDRVAMTDIEARETELSEDSEVALLSGERVHPGLERPDERRLMFVGWSHLLSPILREIASYQTEQFHVTLVCDLDREEVENQLAVDLERMENLTLRSRRINVDDPEAVERLAPHDLDNVVLLGSELTDDPLMADAQTIMAFVQLQQYFREEPETTTPSFVVELNDEDNRDLFKFGMYYDVVMTQEIISHLLSQVGVRRALAWVYEELFTQDGPEIRLRPVDVLFDEPPDPSITFQDLQLHCLQSDTVVLGVRYQYPKGTAQRVRLNPERDEPLDLDPDDQVVIVVAEWPVGGSR